MKKNILTILFLGAFLVSIHDTEAIKKGKKTKKLKKLKNKKSGKKGKGGSGDSQVNLKKTEDLLDDGLVADSSIIEKDKKDKEDSLNKLKLIELGREKKRLIDILCKKIKKLLYQSKKDEDQQAVKEYLSSLIDLNENELKKKFDENKDEKSDGKQILSLLLKNKKIEMLFKRVRKIDKIIKEKVNKGESEEGVIAPQRTPKEKVTYEQATASKIAELEGQINEGMPKEEQATKSKIAKLEGQINEGMPKEEQATKSKIAKLKQQLEGSKISKLKKQLEARIKELKFAIKTEEKNLEKNDNQGDKNNKYSEELVEAYNKNIAEIESILKIYQDEKNLIEDANLKIYQDEKNGKTTNINKEEKALPNKEEKALPNKKEILLQAREKIKENFLEQAEGIIEKNKISSIKEKVLEELETRTKKKDAVVEKLKHNHEKRKKEKEEERENKGLVKNETLETLKNQETELEKNLKTIKNDKERIKIRSKLAEIEKKRKLMKKEEIEKKRKSMREEYISKFKEAIDNNENFKQDEDLKREKKRLKSSGII